MLFFYNIADQNLQFIYLFVMILTNFRCCISLCIPLNFGMYILNFFLSHICDSQCTVLDTLVNKQPHFSFLVNPQLWILQNGEIFVTIIYLNFQLIAPNWPLIAWLSYSPVFYPLEFLVHLQLLQRSLLTLLSRQYGPNLLRQPSFNNDTD